MENKKGRNRLVMVSGLVLCLMVIGGGLLYLLAPVLLPGRMFGVDIAEKPDYTNYATLGERATAALEVARRHKLNEEYCFLVDYSIPSGSPRLFVWSYAENRVVASTYVMHGPGMGSTAAQPKFSSKPGSNCSSLGRFVVTKSHGKKLQRSYRLKGLDTTNQTAWVRGLLIHRAVWVDIYCGRKYIPLNENACKGCVTVSSRGMDYLERVIDGEQSNILLWSFCSQS